MKKQILYILLITIIMTALSTAGNKEKINIIPKPLKVAEGKGYFNLDKDVWIFYNDGLQDHAKFLSEYIKFSAKLDLRVSDKTIPNVKKAIYLFTDNTNDYAEEYELKIETNAIKITSPNSRGVFYAIQSLRQLIHADKKIPCVTINDKPKFVYRGMHLDVSRHFMPKEFVKKYIDFIAMYKMNTFHWHLVDDQGWRLEIKKYPKLTEIGSLRVNRNHLSWRKREFQKPGEVPTYGGFYTQDEVKEIVKYAADRYINIIPEIEMPGHCLAALTPYPEYSCTGGPFTIPPGTYWPPTEAYCAGNDETFKFLEDILTETMEMFPSKYIHIGGDEAIKTRWKECPKCQARIKAENLKNEQELQSYFVKRIEKFVVSKGRKIIGWDEILEGGLAPEATVMSWRGTKGGIEAATAGHDVIMTPTDYCYFDFYQGLQELEPEAIGGYLPLSKVYEFNPIPEELSPEKAKHILGGQGNLWTEFIVEPKHAEYMAFPRIAAMAEVLWTPKELKNWNDFIIRLEKHTKLLKDMDINFARSMYNVKLNSTLDTAKKKIKIEMSTEAGIGDIHYTLDGSIPTKKSAIYKAPFEIKKSAKISAINFYSVNEKSKESKIDVVLHKGNGAKVFGTQPEKRYAKSAFTLVDGVRGSLNHGDGKWQGFQKDDMIATVDLGKTIPVKKITAGFLQNYHFSIFLPRELEISVSDDGKTYKSISKIVTDIPFNREDIFVKDFSCNVNEKIRFIQLKAVNMGTNPESHPDKGYKSWLFTDEIIIE